MKIDWSALGLVAVVAIIASVEVMGMVSVGIASLRAADCRIAVGRSAGSAKAAGSAEATGYACLAVAVLIVLYVLYGLSVIIPQFH